MALAEEVYQRAQCLPDDKVVEVLDFIEYLETVLERQQRAGQLSAPISKKLATSATAAIPVIEDEAPADDWPEPIHVAHWNGHISLRRGDMYGDDER